MLITDKMKRYKDKFDRLIHLSKNGTYKVLNDINPYVITEDEFYNSEPKGLKNSEFSRLMNIYFNKVNHKWIHEGVKFKKLPNFESDDYRLITNYEWNELP